MDEQRTFPTAMFGFDKETVLNYIYELDANAKLREEQLEAESREALSALDALKTKYGEAVSRLEEANSQYEILKAQFYNEKQSTQGQLQSFEQLRKDAQQLAVAARERDNDLQLQKELNKQLQARLDAMQSESDGKSEELSSQYAEKLDELTRRAEDAEAKAAGLERSLTDMQRDYERRLALAAQNAIPPVMQPPYGAYYPAQPYIPAPEPPKPEPPKPERTEPEPPKSKKAKTREYVEDSDDDAEVVSAGREKFITEAVSEAQSELYALKTELSGLKKVLQNRIAEFEDAISGLSTTQRRQYQQLRQRIEESSPLVEPLPIHIEREARPAVEYRVSEATAAPKPEEKFAAAPQPQPEPQPEPEQPASEPEQPAPEPESSDIERKRQKILEIIAEQRRHEAENPAPPKTEDDYGEEGSMEVPGDSFFR